MDTRRIAAGERGQTAWKQNMLRPEHTRCKGVFSIRGSYIKLSLTDQRTFIHSCRYMMNAAAMNGVSRLQTAPVGIDARILRKKRGVNIDEPSRPAVDKPGRQYAHEPRQRHKFRARPSQLFIDNLFKGLPVLSETPVIHDASGRPVTGGARKAAGARNI